MEVPFLMVLKSSCVLMLNHRCLIEEGALWRPPHQLEICRLSEREQNSPRLNALKVSFFQNYPHFVLSYFVKDFV